MSQFAGQQGLGWQSTGPKWNWLQAWRLRCWPWWRWPWTIFLWAALKLLFAVALAGRSRARDLAEGVVPLIRWNPPRFLQVCFFMACGYLACWFASYCFVVGPDFRWLNTTFKLGWTGGGELPSSIQLLALCSTAAVS